MLFQAPAHGKFARIGPHGKRAVGVGVRKLAGKHYHLLGSIIVLLQIFSPPDVAKLSPRGFLGRPGIQRLKYLGGVESIHLGQASSIIINGSQKPKQLLGLLGPGDISYGL